VGGARWRRYVRPARTSLRADVDAEFAFHLEMLVNELIDAGWPPSAARAEAKRRFGPIPVVRDVCLTIDKRRRRRVALADRMHTIIQDLRYAVRGIRRAPGFSLVVALTVALGIGATTTMYSVVDGVLLRPLPYANAERLVALETRSASTQEPTVASFLEYRSWKLRTPAAFDEIGAWFQNGAVLTEGDRAEFLLGERMSASVPRMLGARPVIGRLFTDAEDDLSAPRTVVLSERFWRERFGGDRNIVGRTLQFSGQPVTVVGVFASTAASRLPTELATGRQVSFWFPLRLNAQAVPADLHFMYAMARLRDGVNFSRADAAVQTVARTLNAEHATTNGIVVAPLADDIIGNARRPLTLLLAAVALLLLIACANVANLLLARAAVRRREFAIRLAIGAGRGRLLAQLLAESIVHAVSGGTLGVGVAIGASWWLRHRLSVRLPRFELVSIDARVLTFAIAASVLTGLLFGLAPALHAAGGVGSDALRDGRGASSGGHDRVRRLLMVAEIALSFVLLVEAGLLVRSLHNVLTVPRGFDSSRMTTAGIALPPTSYPDDTRRLAFFRDLLQSLRGAPALTSVALTSSLPIEGGVNGDVNIEGRTLSGTSRPVVEKRIVSAGYFETLGSSLAAGRFFDARDVAGQQSVAIVNEAFVRKWFPNESPIGKRVEFLWGTTGLQTIVGVVADVREGSLRQPGQPAMYVPLDQRPADALSLVVRTSTDAAAVPRIIRATVKAIDPRLPVIDIRTFDDIIATDVAGPRLTTTILIVFAGVALLLAGIGLYGVVSYAVAQRIHEFGIRAALGAQRTDLMNLVWRQSASLFGVGALVGSAAAVAVGRFVAGELFGVAPTDAFTFAAVAVVLGAVTFIAASLPARRATRVDPLEALRGE